MSFLLVVKNTARLDIRKAYGYYEEQQASLEDAVINDEVRIYAVQLTYKRPKINITEI